MNEVFENELMKCSQKHRNLVLMCHGELGDVKSLSKYFFGKFFNFGIGEQNFVSAAAGFVVRGKMPLLLIPANALSRVYEQLKNDICEANLNVKIVVFGEMDDATLSFLEVMPNMNVVSDSIEEMLGNYGPVVMRIR